MSTLSNVKTRRGEANPPSTRFVPDAFPEARSSKTGVSVKYVLTSDKRWYVFRASYGREDKASDYLVEDGTYTYIAKKYIERYVKGKKKRYLQTLIPNLLFAYTTEEKADEYVHKTPALSYLTYYYNHFDVDDEQKNPPLTISCEEMARFIHATCNKNKHLMFVDPSQCHIKVANSLRSQMGHLKGLKAG